jgi:hypothetical protein
VADRSRHFTAAPQQAAQSISHSAHPSQLAPQSAHAVAQQLAVAAGFAAQQACGAAGAATAAPQQRAQSVAQSGQPSHPSAQAGHGAAQQVGADLVAAVTP